MRFSCLHPSTIQVSIIFHSFACWLYNILKLHSVNVIQTSDQLQWQPIQMHSGKWSEFTAQVLSVN